MYYSSTVRSDNSIKVCHKRVPTSYTYLGRRYSGNMSLEALNLEPRGQRSPEVACSVLLRRPPESPVSDVPLAWSRFLFRLAGLSTTTGPASGNVPEREDGLVPPTIGSLGKTPPTLLKGAAFGSGMDFLKSSMRSGAPLNKSDTCRCTYTPIQKDRVENS